MWPESITDADRVALKSSLKSFKRSLSWTVKQVIMNTVMNTNRGEHVVLDINDDMQMTNWNLIVLWLSSVHIVLLIISMNIKLLPLLNNKYKQLEECIASVLRHLSFIFVFIYVSINDRCRKTDKKKCDHLALWEIRWLQHFAWHGTGHKRHHLKKAYTFLNHGKSIIVIWLKIALEIFFQLSV